MSNDYNYLMFGYVVSTPLLIFYVYCEPDLGYDQTEIRTRTDQIAIGN